MLTVGGPLENEVTAPALVGFCVPEVVKSTAASLVADRRATALALLRKSKVLKIFN